MTYEVELGTSSGPGAIATRHRGAVTGGQWACMTVGGAVGDIGVTVDGAGEQLAPLEIEDSGGGTHITCFDVPPNRGPIEIVVEDSGSPRSSAIASITAM